MEGLSMSEREYKHPADVLQDAVCTSMVTPLRILENTNGSELSFRALLSGECATRLELRRA